MYSTWLVSAEYHFMLDCGEGAATALGGKVNTIHHIFLTHSHFDHTAGLINFIQIWARQTQRAPLTIHYPIGMRRIQKYQDLVHDYHDLHWDGLYVDSQVLIAKDLHVSCFDSEHVLPSAEYYGLGYVLNQTRKRLKNEYRGLSEETLASLRHNHKSNAEFSLNEPYVHKLLAYTGDTSPLQQDALDRICGAEILIHDTTYMEAEDRPEGVRHSTLLEALNTARQCENKILMPCHVSAIYGKHLEFPTMIDGIRIVPISHSGYAEEYVL